MTTLLRSSLRVSPLVTLARLTAHLRDPLYRNGYALVLSSAATSVLGILYWVLAARLYSTAVIGVNSALLSALSFLASFAQLNLINALNRFIPTAGSATKRLILGAYLASVGVALLSTLCFLAGLQWWAPPLLFLRDQWWLGGSFVIGVMVYCIFALQDGVLVGMRAAPWVPVENLAFALVKLLVLALLAGVLTEYGVYASWLAPLGLAVLLVNWLIFGRLLPNHLSTTATYTEPLRLATMVRYVAGDYVGSLIWTATIGIMPLLVLQQAGATANAYYYMAWTITYTFYLIGRNMGMALITEVAMQPTQLLTLSYRTLNQTAKLLTPLVLVLVAGAPMILTLFGTAYAAEATTLLRLLALSTLPGMITSLYIAMARSQRRVKALVIVNLALCLTVLGISYCFLPIYGSVAVGWAWLISQSGVALVLLATELRPLWLLHINLVPLFHLLTWPRTLRWRWQHRHLLAQVKELVPLIVATLPPKPGVPVPQHWQVTQILRTVSEMTVAVLGTREQPGIAIFKLPQTPAAATSLQHQNLVTATLRAHPALQRWQHLLPSPLASGEIAGRPYVLETRITGTDIARLALNDQEWVAIQHAACQSISQLHQQTAQTVCISDDMLQRWVNAPLAALQQITPTLLTPADYQAHLQQLQEELRNALTGHTVSTSWIHGDYTPGNILIDPATHTVTGLIDWELAAPDELPQLDLIQFFMTTRLLRQQCEYGDVVCALITRRGWQPQETRLLDAAQEALPGDPLPARTLVLLCWLHHVASTVTKTEQYAHHQWWKARNLEAVLLAL